MRPIARASLIATLSLAFYLRFDPFGRFVGLDAATWDWMAISLPNGLLPYRDIFLHKTPLAAVIGAFGAAGAGLLGLNSLSGAHATSLLFGAAGPALLYLLCRERAGETAALAAAAFMLGFDQWLVAPIEGVRPKVYTTTLGLACLLCADKRRWGAAGALGGAATMCWQPGLVFLAGALMPLLKEPRPVTSMARIAGGAAAIPLTIVAWMWTVGGLADLWAQAVMFNFSYIDIHARPPEVTGERLFALAEQWNSAELILLIPAALGMVRHPNRAPDSLLVAGLVYLGLTFVSFQAWPDMILFAAPLAAVLAVGLSGLMAERASWQAAVLALALILAATPKSARLEPPIDYEQQAAFMQQLTGELTDSDRILVVSLPELNIHTGRRSVWKWPYMWFGVDAFAASTTPGGFDAILGELEADPPALMVVARRWRGPLRQRFEQWARTRYDVQRVHQYPHTVRPINVYRLKAGSEGAVRTSLSDSG